MVLSSFALRTYRREEQPVEDGLVIKIGQPVVRARELRDQAVAWATHPSAGDGWTCPRCRRSTFTHAASCGFCGTSRWTEPQRRESEKEATA